MALRDSSKAPVCEIHGSVKRPDGTVRGWRCRVCHAAYMRGWNSKHKDTISKRNKEYKIKYPKKYKDSQLRNSYGITLEEYNVLLEAQNGKCASCGELEVAVKNHSDQKRDLAVDHCNSTGRIRGLLCARCNTAIGLARDDVDVLRSMIRYLER